LAKICAIYPEVWVDKGLIDIPEENIIKIPLVNNWQNQKIVSKIYPLSKKDFEFLNKIYGAIYKAYKIK